MSFDDPRQSQSQQLQFTNQMAYQSYFVPPGFSFESPFGFQGGMEMGNNAQAGPSSMSMPAMPVQMSMSMPMPMSISMGMNVDSGMNRSFGEMQGFPAPSNGMSSTGNGGGQGPLNSMGSNWMNQPFSGEKTKYEMFPANNVNLLTGDRFSQLLERKLGLDTQPPAFPFDTSQQQFTLPPSSQSDTRPNYPSLPTNSIGRNQSQSWDRMAVEANLQDYSQVQIQPDLVAPVIPATYFPYSQQSQPSNNQPQPQAQEYGRTATPFPGEGVSPQQRYMSYGPGSFQTGYEGSMPTGTFPQASPISTSNRSSPTGVSNQIAGSQIMAEMPWSTSFMPNAVIQQSNASQAFPNQALPSPSSTRPQEIPVPASGQSIYTGYQQVDQGHHRSSGPMQAGSSERSRMANMNGPMPLAHSQSLPSARVGVNGIWSSEMIDSNSSHSLGASSRSSGNQSLTNRTTPPMPTNLPPAPIISKRSRSPHSQHSSSSMEYSPRTQNSSSSITNTKRPKLSVSHPVPNDHDHDGQEEEKKVVIACHTCRARKLKCDGARPKCYHCSRRNEDCCSYDVVLRRRGPGRKNKAKQRSSGATPGAATSGAGSGSGLGLDRSSESGAKLES